MMAWMAQAAENHTAGNRQQTKQKKENAPMSMSITSSSFPHDGVIPTRHTCEGHDTSPELLWTDVPDGAKSLVLIVDDPDAPDPAAPKRVWVHWVLYNIPATSRGLSEAIAAHDLPPGTQEGVNDWQRTGYGGPCPPIGSHRYFHKLYALDTVLPNLKQPTKVKLEEAMRGHILATAELIGRYQKQR
jgi:Raf kinase inhibitor-like YbhB/YbcL family protein